MNAVVEQKRTPVQRKVAVGAAVGGAVSVIVWALDAFAGIKVSGEAAVGLSTALTFVAQYFVPNQELAE
ncbi:MAG TPA: hypothetical protein VEC57_20935 [Candidatus Limnocylindrales bacterium]|nr:hypothetical protein [Candidatus Limnocylindrales bacterium]